MKGDTNIKDSDVRLTIMTTEHELAPLQPLLSIQLKELQYDSGSQPDSMACHCASGSFSFLSPSANSHVIIISPQEDRYVLTCRPRSFQAVEHGQETTLILHARHCMIS
ncbi:uncharacterized [Tachysurus ichikawai]